MGEDSQAYKVFNLEFVTRYCIEIRKEKICNQKSLYYTYWLLLHNVELCIFNHWQKNFTFCQRCQSMYIESKSPEKN